MKKVIFTLAIVSMFGFAACSTNSTNQDSIDSAAKADSIAKVEAEAQAAAEAAAAAADTTAVEAVAEETATIAE